jgi:S-DNA-T family DNA segregation ATPase FtsK/SpoIIIE
MAKKKATAKPKKNKSAPKPHKKDNTDIIIGLLLLLLAAFITISLASFKAAATVNDPLNWGGVLGFLTARFLFTWLGVLAYLIPFLLILWGFNRLLRRPAKRLTLTTLTLLGFAFFVQITLGYFHKVPLFPLRNKAGVILKSMSLGGKIGTSVFEYLASLVGRLGLGFILGFLLLVSLVLIFNINLHKLLTKAIEHSKAAREERKARRAAMLAEREVLAQEQVEEAKVGKERYPAEEEEVEEIAGQKRAAQRIIRTSVMDVSEEELKLAELLDPVPEELTRPPDRETREGAKLLVKRLEEFGVTGSVGDIIPGPVITRYEFHPDPGIKISKIMSLADDLSLSLKAERIRILPIPGKSAVGIEIPNRSRKTVGLRLVAGSKEFVESVNPLTIALGASITGVPQVADLADIPHLLIAGTTGSGKSVCIHSILTSLLIKSSPSDVRFVTIDPKRLELPAYNPIPHLIQPTIVDPRKAAQSLEFVVRIMEERYKEFSRVGARDIAGYNLKARDERKKEKPYIVVVVDELADLMLTAPAEVEQRIIRLAQMARAVGVHLVLATQRPSVDVITGLIKANFPGRIAFQVASKTDSRTILDMNGAEALLGRGDMLFLPPGKGEPVRLHGSFVSTKEVKRIVERLAKARLGALLSTQVDEEKAAEFTDAILAADLLDPLLNPTEPLFETKRQKLAEIISPELVQTISGQYYPPMDELEPIREQMEQQAELGEVDEFFAEAARLVMRHKEASVSMLQRRLNVGWARAGRIIDQLEQAGIVGPYEGSKSRKVLVQDEAELEKILKGLLQG